MAHKFGSVKLFKAYLELSEQAMSPRLLNLRSELQSSGVSLTDCPHNGRKNVADQMIIVDMLTYAIDRPAPATIVLISGDRDFAYAASVLRLRRYSVVVVSLNTRGVHPSLTAQANACLDWNADIMGKVDEQVLGQRQEAASLEETAKPAPIDGTTTSQLREIKNFGSNRHKRDNSAQQRNLQVLLNIDKATQTPPLDTPGSCQARELLEEALKPFDTPSLYEYQLEDVSVKPPCLPTPSTLNDIPIAKDDTIPPYLAPPLDLGFSHKRSEVSRTREANALPISFQPPAGTMDQGGKEEPNSLDELPISTSISSPPSSLISAVPLPSYVDSIPTQAVGSDISTSTERTQAFKNLATVLRPTHEVVATGGVGLGAANRPSEQPTPSQANALPVSDIPQTRNRAAFEKGTEETKSPNNPPPARVEAFKKLVVYLRQRKQYRAPRFAVACELVSAGVIVQAGVQEYLSLAERYTLIEQGGLYAEAWVSLCPQWEVSDEYEVILSQLFAQFSSGETVRLEEVDADNTSASISQSEPPSLASRSPIIYGNGSPAAQPQTLHDTPPGPRASSPDTPLKDETSSTQSPPFVPPIPPLRLVRRHFLPPLRRVMPQAEGELHPIRSKVAEEVKKRNKLAYQEAGVTRFGEYATAAERRGLVYLEAKGREHRISLAPTLHNAPGPSVPSSHSPIHLSTPPLVVTSGNVVVYPYFILLVEILHQFRTEGDPQPTRSKVADGLMRRNKFIYHQAGVERFGEYAALAQRSGLVELGVRGSEHWISLSPTVHIAPGGILDTWSPVSSSVPSPSVSNILNLFPRSNDPQMPRTLQVAAHFLPLINIMEQQISKGVLQPPCSWVSAQLDSYDAYREAGASGFQDYIALAKSARIISVHGGTGKKGRLSFDSSWLQKYS
ncbi:NYN domain-containing protein [Salix suchowensis]|nr:NYN domain-containing protein [Salix suchowensis]